MKRITSIGAVLALIVALSGCGGSSGSAIPSTTVGNNPQISAPSGAPTKHTNDTIGGGGNLFGLLAILLGDAPPVIGNLTPSAINLGIDAVNVVYDGQVTNLATYSTPYVVNVMANQGAPSSIGIGQLYSGDYTQIQFVVDTATSNLVANGTTYPIQFQVGQPTQSSAGAGSGTTTTGNSTTITMTVGGNFMYGGSPAAAVQADFNAMESLNQTSSGQIVAQPTLFAVATATAGQVDGTILNASGSPVTNAVVVALKGNGRVANTVNTDSNGNFNLHTLAAGSYQLVIYNTYTTASGQVLTASGADASSGASFNGPSVTVTAGSTTQLGTIND